MIDETGFMLQDWAESSIEVFEAPQEALDELEDLKQKFEDFCTKHNLPGLMSVCTNQSKINHGVSGTSQFSRSIGRNIPEFLACDQIVKQALVPSLGHIEAVIELDYERNIRETKKGLN
jgi:hypothetical protein